MYSPVEKNPRKINRRTFAISAAGLLVSTPTAVFGIRRSEDHDRQNEQKVASIASPSYTQEERKEAEEVVEKGRDYLDSLSNPRLDDLNQEVPVVDFQSSEFITAEAVMREAVPREKNIAAIREDADGLSIISTTGGIVGTAISAVGLALAFPGRNESEIKPEAKH